MYVTIRNITFDCADAKAQAMFWAAATGWAAHEHDATPGHVEYSVDPPRGFPRLYFTTVPEPKSVKNRSTWMSSHRTMTSRRNWPGLPALALP